jgi:hypothetical protein
MSTIALDKMRKKTGTPATNQLKPDVWLFTSSCLLEVSTLINVICVYLQ